VWGSPVRGVIESINGARFVYDRLEEHGWPMRPRKGLAPLACKTDKIDARVLATVSARDLVAEMSLPDPSIRRERELAWFWLHLVRHRTTLKNRIHAGLLDFGHHARSPIATACTSRSAPAWIVAVGRVGSGRSGR
jgi:transposase